MMRNNIFFQNDKKTFYYDYIFFEAARPIFFSCIDESGQLFIVTLCDDRRELRWIVAKTSRKQLLDIMKDEVTMYDVYLNSNEYYIIVEKNGVTRCNPCNKESVDTLDFPTKGEYYEADEEEIADYIAYINSKINNRSYNNIFKSKKRLMIQRGSVKVTPIEQNNRIEIKMDHINNNINYVA